jgi:hypothetical protein
MNNEIGIGILDLYDQDSLSKCLDSIKNISKDNIIVSSLTKNKSNLENHRAYTSQTPLATLRNHIISQFRLKNIKYFFLLHSNQVVKNENIWNNTIKLAETFGTWFMTGFNKNILTLEDDSNLELNISSNLNSNFLFFTSGMVKNNGYFDERFFNGKELDVIDYIINLRKKNATLPHNFYATIPDNWLEDIKTKNQAVGYFEFPDSDKSLQMAYGYFMHVHKYIPTQSDPQSVSNDELMKCMEDLQKNYAKK